jgi:uncharacterized protein (DUF433 family)
MFSNTRSTGWRSSVVTLAEVEETLAGLSRPEKAQILQWLINDLADAFPGVESTADIAGGDARIAGTRIPVWLLEQARRLGTSEAELLRAYPRLTAEDLANAWAYVRAHRGDIDRQIRENEAA